MNGPDSSFCPPSFYWKDADEITIRSGDYYPLGYRVQGHYQNLAGNNTKWNVPSDYDVEVDLTYNSGVTNGSLGGFCTTSISQWCSVFMLAANNILILPIFAVYAIDYDTTHTGKTTITPGDKEGDAVENGLLLANDVWNDYRLVLVPGLDDDYAGPWTIEDSVNQTNDEVIINGDITSYVVVETKLQMIPPSGIDFLYLGSILMTSIGIIEFKRNGWLFQWCYPRHQNMQKSSSACGNTGAAHCSPPFARMGYLGTAVWSLNESTRYGCACGLNIGSSGGVVIYDPDDITSCASAMIMRTGQASTWWRAMTHHTFPVNSYPGFIRSVATQDQTGVQAAHNAKSYWQGYLE